ncbi:hypothetical protein AaE_016296 [Aphanomyces astaci]|uniref:phosphoribosylaminoimidazolesuccinocarboxamide synthase n=1 Tax=Aphanomyces astaci TaxID=112090 RepID=A0A6A4YYJ4_APHAT|nr:hypothetical protein AaE_016296 [Aphanomyces astaci]
MLNMSGNAMVTQILAEQIDETFEVQADLHSYQRVNVTKLALVVLFIRMMAPHPLEMCPTCTNQGEVPLDSLPIAFINQMSAIVGEAEARTHGYLAQIAATPALSSTELNLPGPVTKHVGKVRDVYVLPERKQVVLVSTDRQSAFDRQLTSVPSKGQVLTLTSSWWFNATRHIVPNHMIANPHPAAVICKQATVFPVEFVVRGYITGSTSTSMWTNYAKGSRDFCGHKLQDGYKQHQKLPENLVTPTTKDDVHDELISGAEVVSSGRMTQAQWDYCHTNGISPENIDKEFLRLWFRDHCDPYNDAVLPEAPKDLVHELSRRYILLYELITGNQFEFRNPSLQDTVGPFFG